LEVNPGYRSQVLVGPDYTVEIFVLDDAVNGERAG
jgi:hypothetical protein